MLYNKIPYIQLIYFKHIYDQHQLLALAEIDRVQFKLALEDLDGFLLCLLQVGAVLHLLSVVEQRAEVSLR